ncbi:MAG: hypothetical protein ACRY3E_04400 [Candidatus Lariskella arthropodorum]
MPLSEAFGARQLKCYSFTKKYVETQHVLNIQADFITCSLVKVIALTQNHDIASQSFTYAAQYIIAHVQLCAAKLASINS